MKKFTGFVILWLVGAPLFILGAVLIADLHQYAAGSVLGILGIAMLIAANVTGVQRNKPQPPQPLRDPEEIMRELIREQLQDARRK